MPKEKKLEAMVKELNPRGEPHVIAGKLFPPGEWVKVTAGEAASLEHAGELVKMRERKD